MEDIKEGNRQQTAAEGTATEIAVVTDSDTKIPEGAYALTLAKPYEFEGRTYTRLVFEFEKLTGNDMINIENEMMAMGEYALSPEVSTSFLCRMAARASGVGSDVISGMPIHDFLKVKNMAQNFLTRTGSTKRTQ